MVEDTRVRDGYKKTEVGVIPEDWDFHQMGNIGETIIGLTYKPENVKSYGLLVLRSSNISNNKLDYNDKVFVDVDVRQKLMVKKDDLLICVRNGSRNLIGKCALIDKRAVGSTFGAFMSLYRSDKSKYLFQYFQSDIIKKQINENIGATINQITNKNMNSFFIGIPSDQKEEQLIVDTLTDTDNLITSLEKLVDKKKKIKQGTMQQLLTGKKRLPGFSGEWNEKEVLEFGDIITGGTPSTEIKEYWNGTIPWVTPTDITNKKYIYSTEREITESGLNVLRKVPANSVLVTCIASIGKNCVLKTDGACNQQINAIITGDRFNSNFLYYLFENNKNYIMSKAGITATNIISKKVFCEIKFKVPPYEEQKAIAQILSDMDSEIESLEQKLSKYKTIKQGMMQELLTGRIRLI